MAVCFGTMFLTLFLIMDSVGNTASFYEVMKAVDPKRYWKVLIRELLIALGFMLLFNFIGEALLNQLEVSEITIRLTSGLILLLFAIGVIFSSPRNLRLNLKTKEEPLIVPLAIPMTAGPALLATIMLYAAVEEDVVCQISAILAAWGLSALILLCNKGMIRLFGTNGLVALERFLALLLVMLGIQRIMEGIELFQKTYMLK